MLTPEQLQAIRERCETTLRGPWEAASREGDDWRSVVAKPGTPIEICQCFYSRGREDQCEANTDFIAHSRTDIPALLAHISELEQERDYWKQAFRLGQELASAPAASQENES